MLIYKRLNSISGERWGTKRSIDPNIGKRFATGSDGKPQLRHEMEVFLYTRWQWEWLYNVEWSQYKLIPHNGYVSIKHTDSGGQQVVTSSTWTIHGLNLNQRKTETQFTGRLVYSTLRSEWIPDQHQHDFPEWPHSNIGHRGRESIGDVMQRLSVIMMSHKSSAKYCQLNNLSIL